MNRLGNEPRLMRSGILVVDPHTLVADLLRETLEVEGYELETASSTDGATQQIERRKFSLALVNLSLPDGDGLHLLPLLKREDPSLEVIMMTGSSPCNAMVVEATEQGAFHYLFKPFDLAEMLRLVSKALECGAVPSRDLRPPAEARRALQ
jgi:DNA-binding NtrC family response regulator